MQEIQLQFRKKIIAKFHARTVTLDHNSLSALLSKLKLPIRA